MSAQSQSSAHPLPLPWTQNAITSFCTGWVSPCGVWFMGYLYLTFQMWSFGVSESGFGASGSVCDYWGWDLCLSLGFLLVSVFGSACRSWGASEGGLRCGDMAQGLKCLGHVFRHNRLSSLLQSKAQGGARERGWASLALRQPRRRICLVLG